MNIKVTGQSKRTETGNQQCEHRYNKELHLVLLCTATLDSAKYVSASTVCDKIETLVGHQLKKHHKQDPTDQDKRDLCNEISNELKKYSRDLKLDFDPKHHNTKLQISVEMLLFLNDTAFLFHIGDSRCYSSQKGEFALLTRDQNNLASWVEHNGTTYEEGQKEKDAFELTNGIGFSGVLMIEPKLVSIAPGDRFLIVSQNVRQSLRSIKLKAILEDIEFDSIPKLTFSELDRAKASGPLGLLACEILTEDDVQRAWGFIERFSIIKKSILFSDLTEEESVKLLSICKTTQIPAGGFLIRQHSHGREIFFVLDGDFEIKANDVTIGKLGPGQVVGEMSAFTGEARSANVIALRLSYLMVFDHNPFVQLLSKEPTIAYKIHNAVIKELSHKIKTINQEKVPVN